MENVNSGKPMRLSNPDPKYYYIDLRKATEKITSPLNMYVISKHYSTKEIKIPMREF